MKIAYLSFEIPGQSGVGQKIQSQISEWEKRGHVIKHYLLKPTYFEYPYKNYVSSYKCSLASATLFFNQFDLKKSLQKFQPHAIYARELPYFIGQNSLLGKFPYFIEVNSNTIEEYKPYFFKYHFYRLTGLTLLNNSRGIICVSDEIADTLHCSPKVPRITISNGYYFHQSTKPPSQDHVKIRFIFVGSPNQRWHGIDQIEMLADELPESEFNIVMRGYISSRSNVIAHGDIYGKDLQNLYSSMDIGISTLALHRKGMDEASSLKTREYIGHGLPLLLGYKDTDLNNFGKKDGVLRIPNKDGAVLTHIGKIKRFAAAWKGKRLNIKKFIPVLSASKKEEIRLSFIESFLDNK